MATIKWEDNITDKIITMEQKKQTAINMLSQQAGQTFENYAKQNRLWRDRTGHARQRLKGYYETSDNGNKTRIYISHGVEYGKWLELAHERRYAILKKTVNTCSKQVLESFKKMFDLMK